METTAPIPTKILQCDKDHQMLFASNPNPRKKMQDGGRPPFWKKSKMAISP